MRACAVQMAHGETLDDNLTRARRAIDDAAREDAELILLPEYFFATFPGGPPASAPHAARIRATLADASRDHHILLAGNIIETTATGLQNIGLLYDNGHLALEQPKIHPMPREAAAGVTGGTRLTSAHIRNHTAGILVCADILYPETARILHLQHADILLNPVMSPWREHDDGREARNAMYIARAYDTAAFVLKAAGHAAGRIAGRSLIAAPWGILAKAQHEFQDELVTAELDFTKLAEFRKRQAEFPPRRPEAYEGLL